MKIYKIVKKNQNYKEIIYYIYNYKNYYISLLLLYIYLKLLRNKI